ncbi:hypothetical protein [Tengunoibacter tsumagoiensis]|uniref:Glycosyltransferase RgtA/B/C/D-like domain-containing protein n=1 Tax=Tengunoibacter tsumagoiensis TaxID=2014871 RepID=A0A402A3Y4_9CHLR|nr:hypothetical protein [Tengunoibacter tsumagoiensis]GCE13769.1 hypothetical protein KTT_36280 [Tengunoibacter tsumagoiensis]
MQQFLRRRLNDGVLFIILMLLLGTFTVLLQINPLHESLFNSFALQAQAWLQGHTDIRTPVLDKVIIHGKMYLVFPPLPPIMMLPFVALLGKNFSDIWFTWIFAAANIVLLFRTLEVMRVSHITQRTPLENVIIALTFGFGTIELWLSLDGIIYMTAQIISVFGILLTLHSTLSRRWTLATLGVSMVLLTRSSEVLIGVFPLIVYLHDLGIGRRTQTRWRFLPLRWPSLREVAVILTPFLLATIILLIRNKVYFDNFLETGYNIQNAQVYPDIHYGVLNWHYLWPNIVIAFLRGPTFTFTGPFDIHPHTDLYIDGIGTSMFFSTPLLAIFIFSPQGKTSSPWLRRAFWTTTAVILLSVLLFCAAGWRQVGARYTLPIYPLLFLLLAQRAAPLDTRWISLAGLGVFINLLLARTFWYKEPSQRFVVTSVIIVTIACITAIVLLHWQRRNSEKQSLDALTSDLDNVDITEKVLANRM